MLVTFDKIKFPESIQSPKRSYGPLYPLMTLYSHMSRT